MYLIITLRNLLEVSNIYKILIYFILNSCHAKFETLTAVLTEIKVF
jgi:hypothetical protein